MVSIITPCYNSFLYIEDAINSVLSQTYPHWEMLIIDDCSIDGSDILIHQYTKIDQRIKYYKTDKPSGSPVFPRNIGIEKANGQYIAFLDSDDIWLPNKLEEQMELFQKNKCCIIYSNYEKINEKGDRNNRFVISPTKATYNQLLKSDFMGLLTVICDISKIGKFSFQEIGHEDYALWLFFLKKGYVAYNTNTITALYRIRKNSVSSNKIRASFWQWNIYIRIEKTGYLKGIYYFMHYVYNGLLKAII
jgi:glycosyltransferase involved in cell wall biosynthesis